jgi:hypothetical protein
MAKDSKRKEGNKLKKKKAFLSHQLYEIIWEIKLFIVYVRKNLDSVNNSSGGMEKYKPLQ